MSILSDVLASKHPTFVKFGTATGLWAKNERRLKGGEDIFSELFAWDYETANTGNHADRKNRAVYTNFPSRMVEKFVGHLSREAPRVGEAVNFGPLGEINLTPSGELTRADRLYRSVDGTGDYGSDWVSYFDGVHKRAMATGHRWLVVEVPAAPEGERTLADERAGQRPYVIEYSPTQVPDWHYDNGVLQYLRVMYSVRTPKVEGTKFEAVDAVRNVLYVKTGYEGLGSAFVGGGWWLYDEDEKLLGSGDWSRTGGDIPAVPFFYEADKTDFSRPAITQIGQVAVAHMNLDSAGDNDAIEGGMRRMWALGVRAEEHEQVVQQIKNGSRFISVPTSSAEGRNPQIIDSAQATANEAVESRMTRHEEQAAFLAMDELRTGANTSGFARQIEFFDVKSPRLALMARNRAAAENAILKFCILRWGETNLSDAHITWKADYDPSPVIRDIAEVFNLMTERKIESATLDTLLIEMALKDKGLATGEIGDEMDKITAEITASKALQSEEPSANGQQNIAAEA
jgi:hypothetical protein